MFLLLRSHLEIPPFTPAVHGDVNCQANLRRVLHAVLVLLYFLDLKCAYQFEIDFESL